MKKVGILGSGNVAQALGSGFLKHGYDVVVGTRDAGKLADWQAKNPGAKLGSFSEAAAHGELLVLAVKGGAALSALELAGAANLRGKTVLDATNPIADLPPVNGVLQYTTSLSQSLMEQLQTAYPDAHFVKSFSCIGSAFMVNPAFTEKPTMFICGNDAGAKAEASALLDQFGFDVVDMGAVEAARAIEPLAILWCIPGFTKNQWAHGLRMVYPK